MKKLLVLLSILVLLLLLSLSSAKATRGVQYYASPEGSGEDCTIDAPCSLQYAVKKAQPGDFVYVHSGNYYAEDSGDHHVLYIQGQFTLFGGCTWTSASDINCSPTTTPSILDGQNMHRVITIEGENTDVNLNGLTIRNGDAHGINTSYCPLKGGAPALGCGGGIFAYDILSLTLGDITFEHNVASSDTTGAGTAMGGALYAYKLHELFIYDSLFTENTSGQTGIGMGGAIYVEGAAVPTTGGISGCVFSANTLPGSDYSRGGAILVYQTGHLEIYRNSFIENNNLKNAIDGAAVYFLEMSSSTFYFAENFISGNYGRTILHSFMTPSRGSFNTIERNVFTGNIADSLIHLEGRDSHIVRNNFITYNSPLRDSRVNQKNIYLVGISPDQLLVYIYQNSIAGGVDAININDYVNPYIKKNIIAHSQGGIYNFGTGVTATIESNLFFGNSSDGSVGTNPFDGDPKFVNMSDGDLHVLRGSAAIDRLSLGEGPGDDIDTIGIRPIGSGPTPFDIGADEYELVNDLFLPLIFR